MLLQYSVDGDPERGGVPADGLLPLADHVAGCAALRLEGLMAVAPLDADPEAAFADIADRRRPATFRPSGGNRPLGGYER